MTRPSPSLVLLRGLPRRAVSRGAGVLARAPLPRALRAPLLSLYARLYGVRLEETARPLRAYATFQDFFTRRLQDGARTTPAEPDAIACPSDGRVHAAGGVSRGTLLRVKGETHVLSDLLGFPPVGTRFDGGTYLSLHLAPGDYHRFHWPFDAVVDEVRVLPGDLWPVHPRAVEALPGLFSRNTRVVVLGQLTGGGAFAFIAVGALNVGSIRLEFLPLRTNRGEGGRPRRIRRPACRAMRGEEMGRFELGSTIVLVLAPEAGSLDALEAGVRVLALDAIGRLRNGSSDRV